MNSNEQNLESVSGCKTVKGKIVVAFSFGIMQHLELWLQFNGTYYHAPINVELPNLQFRVIVAT